MGNYADFRLVLSPDLATRGQWLVSVDDCPLPGLIGPKGSVVPSMTPNELSTLRSRNGWPNPMTLRNIGTAVWKSIMTPLAEAAFEGSLLVAREKHLGLRIVLVVEGEDVPGFGHVGLSELPVEVIYSNAMQFLATDLLTPISRSFQHRPDQDPQRIELPLRVLVAVAAPVDKPPANIAKEVKVIQDAVANMSGPGGSLDIDFIEQATRADVAAQLTRKPYQVLHFIGHGGFDVVGDVEAPRAHLCFVRPDGSGLSDPTDADTLTAILRNTDVRLVVITACSSAAPTPPIPGDPDAGPLGTGAFDGVAQRLVTGISPVTAAVGMQFDLEDVAAVEFSRAFYENLLQPDVALDEVVTLARRALVVRLQAGHRAWVTPAVYWRCKEGKVFSIDASRIELSADALAQIRDVDIRLGIYRAQIEKIAARPPEERAALEEFRLDALSNLDKLHAQRADLVGESVRLLGGRAAPHGEIRCRVSLRLHQPGTVGLVQFILEYPTAALTFSGSDPGADVTGRPLTAAYGQGALQVAIVDPGRGERWAPREYELGFLCFAVSGDANASIVDLRVTRSQVTRDGAAADIRSVDGVAFIEPQPIGRRGG
jgi:hypothetical protein